MIAHYDDVFLSVASECRSSKAGIPPWILSNRGLRPDNPCASGRTFIMVSCRNRQDGMPDRALEGRQSAIDMMVLKALTIEDMHGWGISQYLQRVSRDVLRVNQGSLYPALH